MSTIVKISNLDKYFGRLHVLRDISLEVKRSEVICIIGRSGSGKSTLLRCINFLEEPSGGEIEVEGLVAKAGQITIMKNGNPNRFIATPLLGEVETTSPPYR